MENMGKPVLVHECVVYVVVVRITNEKDNVPLRETLMDDKSDEGFKECFTATAVVHTVTGVKNGPSEKYIGEKNGEYYLLLHRERSVDQYTACIR